MHDVSPVHRTQVNDGGTLTVQLAIMRPLISVCAVEAASTYVVMTINARINGRDVRATILFRLAISLFLLFVTSSP
ncbi:hypothetical protein BVG97_01380 [Serratia marcescens]|nr:hypothetical protein BVG97_01380 [Serratia marcescens]